MQPYNLRRPLGAAASRVLAFLAALFLAIPASAQQRPQPHRVTMGIYVLDVSELDLKTETYAADFYLWVRGDSGMDGTNFEIMNGSGDPCSLGYRRQVGTLRYHVYRCRYVFHHAFDMSEYPLDQHELTMEVEDKEFPQWQMVYVPDLEGTALDSAISLSGWRIGKPRMRISTHAYTRVGDPTLAPDARIRFSKLTVAIPIQRGSVANYLKSFLVMFLSVLVGLMASALECRHVEARLGIGVASIFGVVSSYMVVTQSLPETTQITLADKLHLVGMAFVFVSIGITVAMYRVCGKMDPVKAEQRDAAMGFLGAVSFVLVVTLITVFR